MTRAGAQPAMPRPREVNRLLKAGALNGHLKVRSKKFQDSEVAVG